MRFPGTQLGYRWALLSQKPWLFGSWKKFGIFTLLLLTLPAGMLLFVASASVQNRLERQTFNELAVWSSVFSRQIIEEFAGLTTYVESFASRPSVARAASSMDIESLKNQLAALDENNEKISRAALVNAEGTLIAAHPEDPAVVGRNFAARDWFRGSSKTSSPYISEVYRRSAFGQERVITIGCPVIGMSSRRLGYLAAQYLVSDLNAWVARLLEHTELQVVIVDRNGRAVHDPGKILEHLVQHEHSNAMSGKDQSAQAFKVQLRGEPYFVSKLDISEPDWRLYVVKPWSGAMRPLDEIRTIILVFFALAVTLFSVVGLVWIRTLFRYAHSLERSNRHLEYFCYSIAHNFRAPLRAISGFADILLLEKHQHLDAEAKDFVARISSGAVVMDDLVNDLLVFGSISHAEIKRERVELEPVIRAALLEVDDEIQSRDADVQLVGSFDGVLADKNLLQRVIKELLCNAIKFVSPETTPEVRIRTKGKGNCVRLWVHDNGVGIEKQWQGQIFEIFHKLEMRSAGTGVGLAIAKNAVERMGGSIGVESTPGQGSSFWIELPRG